MRPRRISVFLSYSFRPREQAYSQAEILSVVERACDTARADLSHEFPTLLISVTAELVEYGGQLNKEMLERLETSDICIVDISDNNPNVFYELGALHVLRKRPILMKAMAADANFPVPGDIAGFMMLKYATIGDVQGRLAAAIKAGCFEVLTRTKHALDLCREFWGPGEQTRTNHVLTAQRSSSKTAFGECSSPNFIYLDRLGDKDAVVEMSVLLARLYPAVPIVRYSSDEMPRDAYEAELFVIGGPGGTDAEGAKNVLVTPLHEKLNLHVRYSDDCERMIVEEKEHIAKEEDGRLVQDYGFFARARNPYYPARSVVLMHGIHTCGVLGAARCFSDHPVALSNIVTVLKALGPDPLFWTYFPVDVVSGVAMVPSITESRIFPLK